ncbi:hypothetical protein B0T25DRAFT_220624 [Lasiosphaeria hispida]|uniref:F-box domain-containing protein n=1 Tax=Lasiosphaeria hispida TaxID=260671 RepID=A0AAJ0MER2_9PEZI|nr:hypothetical protein B0T25DRAFT_220624 [Lasiosphaeria hispida]
MKPQCNPPRPCWSKGQPEDSDLERESQGRHPNHQARRTLQKKKAPRKPRCRDPAFIAARSTVFSTHELAVLIFSDLDARTLLTRIQRVCTLWRDIIATSPPLQRRLFFAADPDTPSPRAPPASKARLVQNPLLRDAFPLLFADHTRLEAQPWHDLRYLLSNGQWRHDAFELLEKGLITGEFAATYKLTPWRLSTDKPHNALAIADVRDGRRLHDALTTSGASWRRMLVSQPPPVRVARVRGTEGSDMVDVPGGLRMGDLWDEVFTILWQAGDRKPEVVPMVWIGWRVPERMGLPMSLAGRVGGPGSWDAESEASDDGSFHHEGDPSIPNGLSEAAEKNDESSLAVVLPYDQWLGAADLVIGDGEYYDSDSSDFYWEFYPDSYSVRDPVKAQRKKARSEWVFRCKDYRYRARRGRLDTITTTGTDRLPPN